MADRLKISEVDFDTIKNNLKDFLRNQNEFTDYDFEGSGLSILLDILAYNTHYQAYYLNMVANESFLDTALLRDSVVSHAKTLGYRPTSKKAAVARINLLVDAASSEENSLTITRGTTFLSNQIDGKTYTFVVLNDVTVAKAADSFYFEELLIYEGQLNQIQYTYNSINNPKSIFLLPDANIDITSLKVSVFPSEQSTTQTVYELVDDLTNVLSDSEVYFLQEEKSGRYQIYFGDGTVGKALENGSVIRVSYLTTNGIDANGAETFVISQPLSGFTNFDITTAVIAAGGSDRQSVDSIKYLAPLQYASQNRIVTLSDYELAIKKAYPNIDSVSVWGGDEQVPPIYGKVFISLNPSSGYYITESEKENIIKNIIEPKTVTTIDAEILDPEFIYILTNTTVQYNPAKTTLSPEALKNVIRQTILNYKNLNLNTFSSKFIVSKLDEAINYSDASIVGSQTSINVQKRFLPILGTVSNYEINFNLPLSQGSGVNKLTSSEFDVFDSTGIIRKVILEEVPKSFTGINEIQVLNPGNGYTSEPTVTIVGDGFGATARAIVSLGKIQRIEVLTSGLDYNRATAIISGGGGFGATALPIIDTKVGTLRTIYYTSNAERIVVNSNVGDINYQDGLITLRDLNILNSYTQTGLVRVDVGVDSSIIQSSRNTILTIDETENSSILINLQTE